jgi:hypothetical protein
MDWPVVILVICILGIAAGTTSEFLKIRLASGQSEEIRQLINRYEQLAEKTLDAQQRTAADVAELRARAASIEQILRSVE